MLEMLQNDKCYNVSGTAKRIKTSRGKLNLTHSRINESSYNNEESAREIEFLTIDLRRPMNIGDN